MTRSQRRPFIVGEVVVAVAPPRTRVGRCGTRVENQPGQCAYTRPRPRPRPRSGGHTFLDVNVVGQTYPGLPARVGLGPPSASVRTSGSAAPGVATSLGVGRESSAHRYKVDSTVESTGPSRKGDTFSDYDNPWRRDHQGSRPREWRQQADYLSPPYSRMPGECTVVVRVVMVSTDRTWRAHRPRSRDPRRRRAG